jgi:hypothetical protein
LQLPAVQDTDVDRALCQLFRGFNLGHGTSYEPRRAARSAFEFLQFGVILVSLATRCFEIEHQVFHIQPELAQSVLHERQNPPSALGAFNDPLQGGHKLA